MEEQVATFCAHSRNGVSVTDSVLSKVEATRFVSCCLSFSPKPTAKCHHEEKIVKDAVVLYCVASEPGHSDLRHSAWDRAQQAKTSALGPPGRGTLLLQFINLYLENRLSEVVELFCSFSVVWCVASKFIAIGFFLA